jgi:SAM-dependent methyltransferase
LSAQAQPSTQKWPKQLPELTEEQRRVRDDFMEHWHTVLPNKYGAIEKFNHGWPASYAVRGKKTLEIGAGLGEHLEFEPEPEPGTYVCNELRAPMAEEIKRRYPAVDVVVGDCQEGLPFPDGSFDRVMAIHVLEHLPNLPAALRELRRLVADDGRLIAMIPCEGGLAYGLARRISAQRVFEKRYKMSYDWCIASEHINVPAEIIEECEREFTLVRRTFFPLRAPIVTANLVIGLEYAPRLG